MNYIVLVMVKIGKVFAKLEKAFTPPPTVTKAIEKAFTPPPPLPSPSTVTKAIEKAFTPAPLPAPSSITKELENVVKAIAPKPQQTATQTTPQDQAQEVQKPKDQAQEVQKPPPRQDKIKVGISSKLVIYAIIVIIVLYILNKL